jgi:(p)ppGpp synthase/HD superfamily hydrolase
MDDALLVQRQEKLLEYTKKKGILRGRLQGMAIANPDWFRAVNALNFGEKHHPGFRKDKITPSYMHQVEMALFALTLLPHVLHQVRLIVAVLLHDTPEDTRISHEEIRLKFGHESSDDIELLTKEYRGTKKEMDIYFLDMTGNPVSSLAKGIDRINNISTMAGVFKLEKQIEYCVETRTYFFSMLKTARKNFPEQDLAYENIKFVLTAQLRIFEGANAQGVAA